MSKYTTRITPCQSWGVKYISLWSEVSGFVFKLQVYLLVPGNEEVAKEEADHLFAGTDDDHDDFLRFENTLHIS